MRDRQTRPDLRPARRGFWGDQLAQGGHRRRLGGTQQIRVKRHSAPSGIGRPMRHPTLGGRNHASCLIQAAQGLRAINLNSQRVCGINAIADRTVHRGAGGDQPLEQRIKHIILAAGDVEQLGAVARRGAQRGNGARL